MPVTASSLRAVVMARSAGERALRVELAELRAMNAELRREQVLLGERVQALAEARGLLAEENQLLRGRVAELERRLGQNPRNSDRPPSTEGYAKPAPRSRREPTERRPGGQLGHPGRTLRQVSEPDERVVHRPAGCAGCGGSLTGASVIGVERRQVFDLPELKLRVVEHVLARCRCGCGRDTTAAAPTGIGGPTQYGSGVRGLATYLLTAQHLSLMRTAELFTELLDAPVSEGSLAGWCAAAADRLTDFDAALAARLAAAAVLGADETGIRVAGRTAWVHATRTDACTRYTVSTRRGAPAMTAAGVLPALAGDAVLVHDFWAAYWHFDVLHAVCGAHLLRELTAAAEADGQADWADRLDQLLRGLNTAAHAARAAGEPALADDLIIDARHAYAQLIGAGWTANPGHAAGRRFSRSRRPKHVNLLDRLDEHRDEVLRFATDLRVPFTNNGSEQDVRPLKIKLKVAGCLRTMAGAEAFCRLRSYLSTARKHHRSAFAVLRDLHEGDPWLPVAMQTS
jgi:transposase